MTEALACVVSTEQFWCKKVKQSRVPPKKTVPGRVWGVEGRDGGGGGGGSEPEPDRDKRVWVR